MERDREHRNRASQDDQHGQRDPAFPADIAQAGHREGAGDGAQAEMERNIA